MPTQGKARREFEESSVPSTRRWRGKRGLPGIVSIIWAMVRLRLHWEVKGGRGQSRSDMSRQIVPESRKLHEEEDTSGTRGKTWRIEYATRNFEPPHRLKEKENAL